MVKVIGCAFAGFLIIYFPFIDFSSKEFVVLYNVRISQFDLSLEILEYFSVAAMFIFSLKQQCVLFLFISGFEWLSENIKLIMELEHLQRFPLNEWVVYFTRLYERYMKKNIANESLMSSMRTIFNFYFHWLKIMAIVWVIKMGYQRYLKKCMEDFRNR